MSQSGLRRQAEKIVLTVRSLSELLREQRDRYLDGNTGAGAMSETERNQVRVWCLGVIMRVVPGRWTLERMRLLGSVTS